MYFFMFIDKIFIKKVDRGYLMKKNVRVLLTVLVIIIVAVGGYFVYRGQDTSTTETVENEPSEETKSTTNTQISGKTLVVYYSAQNRTKDVSEKLAENLNADFFEIEPKEKYSEDDLDWQMITQE